MSMKKCPKCFNMDIPEEQEICFYCGYQFPVIKKKIEKPETTIGDEHIEPPKTVEIKDEPPTPVVRKEDPPKSEETPVKITGETPWSQTKVLDKIDNQRKKSPLKSIILIALVIVALVFVIKSCNTTDDTTTTYTSDTSGEDTNTDNTTEDGSDTEVVPYEDVELSYETADCEHCGRTYYSEREWVPVSDDSNIRWNEDGSTPLEFYNPDEHCYELFVSDCTWEEAQLKCEKMGGHLVTITCYEEFDRVASMLNSIDGIYPTDGHPYQIWIGFYYEEDANGQMRAYSVNGDMGLISNWAHHANGVTEPTFSDPNTGEVEDKFSMYYNPSVSANPKYGWVWNTLNNDVSKYHSGKIAFICEWEHCTVEADYSQISDDSGYVLANSSDVLLSYSDVSHLTQAESRIARNEIYARHGRRFSDEQLQGYFDSCSWYSGTIEPEDFDDSYITDIERKNLDLLVQYETDMGWR